MTYDRLQISGEINKLTHSKMRIPALVLPGVEDAHVSLVHGEHDLPVPGREHGRGGGRCWGGEGDSVAAVGQTSLVRAGQVQPVGGGTAEGGHMEHPVHWKGVVDGVVGGQGV